MPKNLIVLMEGSGNAFDGEPSNVTRALDMIALGKIKPVGSYDSQLAIWDYGVGTRIRAVDDAPAAAAKIRADVDAKEEDLIVLDPPRRPCWMPGAVAKLLGLAVGYGIESNVSEAVAKLACCYKPGDRLYLFGFSRGAFTVRVLSALLYRFGLPDSATADVGSWVSKRLCEMQSWATVDHVQVPTHFLGLWDTVKSYGFIRPKRYFHLRHNPGVLHVRHALALDEKRAWFQCTTWGGLDRDLHQLDGDAADDQPRRFKPEPNPNQTVEEVWFRGWHSDIGGGNAERRNAEVALRWMLEKASDKEVGLVLNHKWTTFLEAPSPQCPITPTERWTFGWRWADYIPRLEIDNDYSPARLPCAFGHTGARRPAELVREGKSEVHPSARLWKG